MTALQDRIITYVTKMNCLVSLSKLISVTADVGFTEEEVLHALDGIGKKLRATVRGNEVYYSIPPPPTTPKTQTHIRWIKHNYPTEEILESPFKVCMCAVSHIHWKPEMGHFPDCDSVVYSVEYQKQNPWDKTAGEIINLELYEKECAKQKAVRKRYSKRHLSVSKK